MKKLDSSPRGFVHQLQNLRPGHFLFRSRLFRKISGTVLAILLILSLGNILFITGAEGNKHKAALSHHENSFILKLGTGYIFVSLLTGLFAALIIYWFITKDLQKITVAVKRFKEGDYSARIEGKCKNDLTLMASTFNEMADSILRNTEKIQTMEKLRKELMANVSHDLRTPLSIMQGYIETLIIKKEVISNADRDRYLNIILNSSQNLAHLVAQLFEYTRLEANQVEPVKEAFFLNELLGDVLMKFEIMAAKRNISLLLESDQNASLVFADVSLVERILQNLLDNAIKYTRDGGNITVSIRNIYDGVEIRITDDGIGIKKEDQPYIFERYRQSQQPIPSAANTGAGLGLAIVKKILEIHQSNIHVSSEPGKGTSFWFRLPAYALKNSFLN